MEAIKAVRALVVRYRKIERELYRLHEHSLERIALEKEIGSIRTELTQIFEQCDNVLQVTKAYKRESALLHIFEKSTELEIGCWD